MWLDRIGGNFTSARAANGAASSSANESRKRGMLPPCVARKKHDTQCALILFRTMAGAIGSGYDALKGEYTVPIGEEHGKGQSVAARVHAAFTGSVDRLWPAGLVCA